MYYYCTLHRLQYIVNTPFMCTGKPKPSCDSLYWDICNKFAIYCSGLDLNHSISKVCL